MKRNLLLQATWSSIQEFARSRSYGCCLQRIPKTFAVNEMFDKHKMARFDCIDSKRVFVSMVSAKDLFSASRDPSRMDKKPNNGEKEKRVIGANSREAKRRLKWSVAYQLRRIVFDSERYINTLCKQSNVPVPQHGLQTLSGQELKAFDGNELQEKLTSIANAGSFKKKSTLLRTFEDEFQLRLHSMEIGQLLYVADVFITCRYKASSFMDRLLSWVADRWDMLSISPQAVTQLAFLIAVNGRCGIDLLSKMENYLHRNLETFRLDEVAVICLGFYRAHTSFRSYPLMNDIAAKVLADWDQIHVHLLNNIFKQFKYGGYMTPSYYNTLGHDVAAKYANQKIPGINVDLFIVLRLYASTRIYNESLVKTAHDRLVEFITREQKNSNDVLGKYRGKDVAKLLWAFATFGYDLERTVIDSVVSSLSSRIDSGEVAQFPEILVDVLLSLSYLGHYPVSLLNHLFSKTFLKAVWDHPIASKKEEAVLIWRSSQIESPSYQISDQNSNHLAQLASRLPVSAQHSVELELKRRTGLCEVLLSLQQLLPGHKVTCTFPLPQFDTASITVEQQSANSVVPSCKTSSDSLSGPTQPQGGASVLSQLLQENNKNSNFPWILSDGCEDSVVSYPPLGGEDHCPKRFVIEVHGFNQYASCQSRLLGLHRMKVRQLRLSENHVLVVPPTVALRLSEASESDREQYLSETILTHVLGH